MTKLKHQKVNYMNYKESKYESEIFVCPHCRKNFYKRTKQISKIKLTKE